MLPFFSLGSKIDGRIVHSEREKKTRENNPNERKTFSKTKSKFKFTSTKSHQNAIIFLLVVFFIRGDRLKITSFFFCSQFFAESFFFTRVIWRSWIDEKNWNEKKKKKTNVKRSCTSLHKSEAHASLLTLICITFKFCSLSQVRAPIPMTVYKMRGTMACSCACVVLIHSLLLYFICFIVSAIQ